jgi:curved DNA-binding protein CbpA
MDDYYGLMGVDPDADVDTIRTAYRTRKDELSGDDAKKLNKAWNVLSDPYQRGRYDEQRESTNDTDDIEVIDDDEPAPNGSRPPARAPRQARPPLKPTLVLPKGMEFATRRQRLFAMGIDLFVLFIVFTALSQFAVAAVANAQQPKVVDKINAITKQIDQLNNDKTTANNAAKKAPANSEEQKADQQKVKDLQTQIDAQSKERDKQNAKLAPIYYAFVGLSFLIGFLYLVIPSMGNGRTLGKRFQHIRVVHEDGSPARSGDIIRRYGAPVLAAFALSLVPFIGVIGVAVVLLVTTRWLSNANQQGMHDRWAHTIVVQDET